MNPPSAPATGSQDGGVAIDLVSGPTTPGSIDDFELAHARSELARLKRLLGREGLLDLLDAEIRAGNQTLRQHALDSNGALSSGTTELRVTGLHAVAFLTWLQAAFDREPVLLAAEPDHYVMVQGPDGAVDLAENMGPHLCRVELPAMSHAGISAEDERLPEVASASEFPMRRLATMRLDDGTVVGRVLTQLRDTDEGFVARLTCFFPTTCPDEVIEHHLQHFAVEFRNWIRQAAAELAAS